MNQPWGGVRRGCIQGSRPRFARPSTAPLRPPASEDSPQNLQMNGGVSLEMYACKSSCEGIKCCKHSTKHLGTMKHPNAMHAKELSNNIFWTCLNTYRAWNPSQVNPIFHRYQYQIVSSRFCPCKAWNPNGPLSVSYFSMDSCIVRIVIDGSGVVSNLEDKIAIHEVGFHHWDISCEIFETFDTTRVLYCPSPSGLQTFCLSGFR